MSRNLKSCRALISAILVQAFCDAMSKDPQANSDQAKKFIDEENEMFQFYCHLLGEDPVYVANKMQKRIRKGDLRPLSILRE